MGVEVCPVYRIKSIQLPSIHVDAMLCDPQPKGLKRKFPEEDESDPPPTKSYSQQRQEVFELSYEKLCRFRQNPDSSLLRYVLIFNTMRKVEQEMEREGIKVANCMSSAPFLPMPNSDVSTLDPPPNTLEGMPTPIGFPPSPYAMEVVDCRNVLPSVIHPLASANDSTYNGGSTSAAAYGGDYDNRCVMDLESCTSGRATPFVRTSYDRVESGALWTEESDRLTILNWSSVFSSSSSNSITSSCSSTKSTVANSHYEVSHSSCNGNHSSSNGGGCNNESSGDDAACSGNCSSSETSLHTLMPPTAGATSCMSNLSISQSSSSSSTSPSSGNASPTSGSSPTSSSEDEIFGDIDLTLYDFDLLSPLSPPNVRMAPVSAEELMRSLSNGSDSSTTTNPCLTPGYYKNELFGGDDHVATSVRS